MVANPSTVIKQTNTPYSTMATPLVFVCPHSRFTPTTHSNQEGHHQGPNSAGLTRQQLFVRPNALQNQQNAQPTPVSSPNSHKNAQFCFCARAIPTMSGAQHDYSATETPIMTSSPDINSLMRRSISATPILTEAEEADLVERWCTHKDIKARNALIEAHGKLVASMASKFQNSGAEFSDLVHEGYIALAAAADRFDPSRKNRFSTYAAWWIFSVLQDAVHRDIYSVKIGRSRPEKKALRLLGTARQYLGSNLDNDAFERIAEISNCPIDVVRKVDGAISSRAISLNATVGQDNTSGEMGDFMEDEQARDNSAEHRIQTRHQRRVLEDALSRLQDARAAKILRERFLLEEERPLKDIANDLSISSERVRQIERDALIELKSALQKTGHSLDILFS